MGAAGLIGGSLVGGLTSGIGGYFAAQQQQKAQKEALQAQQAEAARAREFAQGQAGDANALIQQATGQAQDTLGQYYQGARGDLTGAQGGIESALMGGAAQGGQAIRQGLAGAESALSPVAGLAGMAGGAASAISPYDVTGAQSRLGGMIDQGMFSGFESDPGYQFRKQQGEQALQRQASAMGNRRGGATAKAMGEFNQGLASQEFGNFANRQLAQAGMAGQVDQMGLSALMNQAGRSDNAQLSAKQNQYGLASQGLGAMGQIAGMRSGAGNNLAQMLYGAGQGIAGSRGQLGQNLANAGMGTGTNLANMISGGAQSQAGNLMNVAGMNTNLAQGLMPMYGQAAQGAGQGIANIGNAANSTLGNLMTLGIGGHLGGGGGAGGYNPGSYGGDPFASGLGVGYYGDQWYGGNVRS